MEEEGQHRLVASLREKEERERRTRRDPAWRSHPSCPSERVELGGRWGKSRKRSGGAVRGTRWLGEWCWWWEESEAVCWERRGGG